MNGYSVIKPELLNKEGCEFGRRVEMRHEALEKTVEERLVPLLDRLDNRIDDLDRKLARIEVWRQVGTGVVAAIVSFLTAHFTGR